MAPLMNRFLLLTLVALFAAACGAVLGESPTELVVEAQQEAAFTDPAAAKPEEMVPQPTAILIPTLPALVSSSEDDQEIAELPFVGADLGPLAAMEDNLATGQTAADFDVRALGGSTFNLSAQRGSYVLLYPTVVGCGDCVFTLSQLAAAYPEAGAENLKVVIIDLFPEDVPEIWLEFVDLYSDLGFIWSVVNTTDFVIDYEIRSLGTVLVVDPQGKLVYRRNYPLVEDEFRQLFDLLKG